MGKLYTDRKKEEDRPLNDFYTTPKCLTWELLNVENNGVRIFNKHESEVRWIL